MARPRTLYALDKFSRKVAVTYIYIYIYADLLLLSFRLSLLVCFLLVPSSLLAFLLSFPQQLQQAVAGGRMCGALRPYSKR